MDVFGGTFPSLSRRQIDLHGCSWKKFLKCFSVCVLYKCITLNKRPKWYAMKSLHSNAAAIKRILFFLQYKLVLCLSSTHWSNPIGCRWNDRSCMLSLLTKLSARICLCVFPGTNFCGLGNNCHSNATCINLTTRFACQCLPGYRGDGVHCEGKSRTILSVTLK